MAVKNVKEVLSEECERIGLVRQVGKGDVPMTLDKDKNGQFIVTQDRTRYGMPDFLTDSQRKKLWAEIAKLVRRYKIKVLDHVDDLSM